MAPGGLHAQSFHYFRYKVNANADSSFEALLTLYPNGTATARVGDSRVTGDSARLYELDLTDSIIPQLAAPQVIQLIARKAEVIGTMETGGAMPFQPLFECRKQVENMIDFYAPATIQCLDGGQWRPAVVTEKKEFSTANIDSVLVKQFYAANSPYFVQLFGNRQKPGLIARGGLNQEQKKMKIWMIVVTDLLDEKVGKSCARDKENISYTFTQIAKKVGLQPPVITYLNGAQFSRQSVLNALSKINPSPADMVIFYYSGHGYREINDSSPLPKMILSNDYTFESLPKKSLGMQTVAELLSKKKSRLNLLINDCCNVECCPVPSPAVGKNPLISPKSIGLPVSTENFIKLFLEPTGTVVASSSMPKEYSVGNPEKGGFFTWYLRIALEKQLSQYKRDIAWDDIFSEAAKNANYLALTGLCGEENNKSRCIQNPWFDVSNLTLK